MTKENTRLQHLLNLFSEDESDAFILFALAKEYEKLGDFELAIDHYEKLRSNDPEYVGLYYHLGMLHQELEDYTEAMEVYVQGIAIAKKIGDQHALSELQGVKMNLELEL